MRSKPLFGLALYACLIGIVAETTNGAELSAKDLAITPSEVILIGSKSQQQVIVSGTLGQRTVDLTRDVRYRTEAPEVVAVDEQGLLTPRGDGEARVIASLGDQEVSLNVRVERSNEPVRIGFEHDIMPILSKASCNSGPCHGKAGGQNGFALSLLGYDPDTDYETITRDALGRRVFRAAPTQSLLLLKATAQVPHAGGPLLKEGDPSYEAIQLWIEQDLPRDPADAPKLTGLSIAPTERIMDPGQEQQAIATAHYSDGSSRDVTSLAAFQSNESTIVSVSDEGLILAGSIPGEAAIMARFEGHFATANITIPLPGEVSEEVYANLPRQNFIDDLVWEKLQKLGITPSEPADEATFHRRAYLDVIGRLPTPDETRAFLADDDPEKRIKLIDRLLDRPEYADYWANKWTDLLRPNPYRVGIKAVRTLDAWIRDAFRQNMPYDEFVRQIVSARGSTFRDGPSVIFRDRRDPSEAGTMVSQLFLGIRIGCAECHHHPFEVWGQDDFYSFAAFFARIGRKGRGISPPISGSEEILFTAKRGEVKHPLTDEVMPPRPLFGDSEVSEDPDTDVRETLAAWITAPENDYFNQVIANRVWAELMGHGIVDPVDDIRATNPPSNGPLLEALADHFRDQKYDMKALIRTIMTSHVYGLSTLPNDRNATDSRNDSRHYRARLRAEALLDAIDDVTDIPSTFAAAPPRTRAAALWTVRTESLFLDAFGRPDPNQDPPCERVPETSVVQALHLMNAPRLHEKITSDEGRAATLAQSDLTPEEIVEELYLLTYCRYPTDAERDFAAELIKQAGENRRKPVEDLLWGLINTPEFVFKD